MGFARPLRLQDPVAAQKPWNELGAFYHHASSQSREIHRELIGLGLKPLLPLTTLAPLTEELANFKGQQNTIATSEAIPLLGPFYQGDTTDLDRLENTLHFAQAVVHAPLPPTVQDQLLAIEAAQAVDRIQGAAQRLAQDLETERQYRQAFFHQGKPNAETMFGDPSVVNLRPEQIMVRLNRALADGDDLPVWINYHRARQQVTDDGMACLVEAFEHEQLPLQNLEGVYQFVFYRSLLRCVYQQYPELNQFSGMEQAQARQQFQKSDRQLLNLSQQQLAATLHQTKAEPGNCRGKRSQWTDFALIKNEVYKQKRHISQRDLFQRASVALQQLQPCWMMSPISVAQFVPPDAVSFDLVIIDEASQMRPEEALGAIARAQQLIVVGDPQQLPPTNFFKASFNQDLEEDAEEETEGIDDESILDMALKSFYPARRLKWHYRSRHESLIAFSNQHFYGDSLTIFPSPNNQFAVEYHYVEDGAYRSGLNLPEVAAVAQAAAAFMKQFPHLSLGVVTLNQKQQESLLDEMDQLFAQDPTLEKYRAVRENTLEPFFVKNLENVQGDERDVIFISTVYGPEAPGKTVKQRFGPINSRHGHRRLNVLFTRAKQRVVLFSSMKSTDIRPTDSSNRGVHMLRAYLEYAQTHQLPTTVDTGREPQSDFEKFVAERLNQQGYGVVPQVGVSGYFIDLAVVDPDRPDRYLLGIECDGHTYHSSKTTRDRDRLRQQVLEGLGWRLYRIWSIDWFMNPTAEMDKLIAHLKALAG